MAAASGEGLKQGEKAEQVAVTISDLRRAAAKAAPKLARITLAPDQSVKYLDEPVRDENGRVKLGAMMVAVYLKDEQMETLGVSTRVVKVATKKLPGSVPVEPKPGKTGMFIPALEGANIVKYPNGLNLFPKMGAVIPTAAKTEEVPF